jgi:CheY-like chemotaxis protein
MSTHRALVVEDDHDLAAIFSQALRAAGFDVEIAQTLETALARLAADVPDVVTLDLHLQQAKGTEILHYIRSDPRLAKVNVVLTTADSAMAEELQDQADFVFVKPISFVQLRDLAIRLKPAAVD